MLDTFRFCSTSCVMGPFDKLSMRELSERRVRLLLSRRGASEKSSRNIRFVDTPDKLSYSDSMCGLADGS
jgi:hypothetical protein